MSISDDDWRASIDGRLLELRPPDRYGVEITYWEPELDAIATAIGFPPLNGAMRSVLMDTIMKREHQARAKGALVLWNWASKDIWPDAIDKRYPVRMNESLCIPVGVMSAADLVRHARYALAKERVALARMEYKAKVYRSLARKSPGSGLLFS